MGRTKRTPTQRQRDLEIIASMYLRGVNQYDIAAELGISQSQVCYDLKEIHKRWRESSLINMHEAKQRELDRIDELERTYWQAWEDSREERTRTRTMRDPEGKVVATVEKEQRSGNPAFLSGVQSCIDQRCKILGLYEAAKISLDWRKSVEDQGHDASAIFESLVNQFVTGIE